MKTTLIALVILCIMFWEPQIGNAQSTPGKIKYEINGVLETPRFSSRNISTEAMNSSVQSFGYYGVGGNIGFEVGMSYQIHERHSLAGRLGGYFVTTSAAIIQFDPPITRTMDADLNSLPIIYTNGSARLELSHRYLLYDKGKVQFSLNSGVGLRYWSWDQTSEITYLDFFAGPNRIPIGEYSSSSIRPLHPDLNLGLSLVLKDFFKNIDLFASYTYLWAPFDAFRMDSLTFRDGAGVENQFQFNNQVNLGQLRVGFIFSLGRDKKGDEVTL